MLLSLVSITPLNLALVHLNQSHAPRMCEARQSEMSNAEKIPATRKEHSFVIICSEARCYNYTFIILNGWAFY